MLFVDSKSYHYLTVIILQQGSSDLFGPFLCGYAVLNFLCLQQLIYHFHWELPQKPNFPLRVAG